MDTTHRSNKSQELKKNGISYENVEEESGNKSVICF